MVKPMDLFNVAFTLLFIALGAIMKSEDLAILCFGAAGLVALLGIYQHTTRLHLRRMTTSIGSGIVVVLVVIFLQRLRSIPNDRMLLAVIFCATAAILYLLSLIRVLDVENTSSIEDEVERRIEALNAQHQSEKDALEKQVEELDSRTKELDKEKTTLETNRTEDARTIERLQTNENALQISLSSRDDELNKYAWLRERADDQAVDISSYVVIERVVMINQHPATPSIRFCFYIRNKSIYDVIIANEIKGKIWFDGKSLNYAATVLGNDTKVLPYLEVRILDIEQPLGTKEVEHISKYGDNARTYFSLDELYISIRGSESFPQVKPQRLITKDKFPELPLSNVKELKDHIKELERGKAALETKSEEDARIIEQLQQETTALQNCITLRDNERDSLQSEFDTHKAQYKWLYERAEYQLRQLRKYVIVEDCILNPSYLSEGKLYVEFTFYVFNYSMYSVSIPISVGAVIEGSIHYKGNMLSGVAKLVENKVKNSPPRGRDHFIIRQWVSSDEAIDISNTLKKSGNLFDFSELIVNISGGDEYSNVEPTPLDLTRRVENVNLENKIIELENKIVQLKREVTSWQEHENYIEELNRALGTYYLAYNQLEKEELLSANTIENLKMRISHALSQSPNSPKGLFDFKDELPPIPDSNSVDDQKAWVDARCFELRALIDEQRKEQSLTSESSPLPKK